MDYMIDFSVQFIRDWGFQILSDIVIIFVLAKLLYNPVRKFLADRRERISTNISDSENALVDANVLKEEYESKLANIEKERIEILDEARKVAKEQEAQIIAAAREEAEILKNRAETAIKREEERARDDMRKNIIDLSTALATSVIAKNIDEDTQNKLLDEVIDGLGEVKWQN